MRTCIVLLLTAMVVVASAQVKDGKISDTHRLIVAYDLASSIEREGVYLQLINLKGLDARVIELALENRNLSANTTEMCVKLLGRVGDDKSVQVLAMLLKGRPTLAAEALIAINTIDCVQGLTFARQALSARRDIALVAISIVSQSNLRSDYELMQQMLSSKDAEIRARVIETLRIPPHDLDARLMVRKVIRENMRHPALVVRSAIVYRLGWEQDEIAEDVLTYLILKDADMEIRESALGTLKRILRS